MEADRVSHEVRNVAERLISLEPDQYGNALDQYFEDNVVYESRGIHLQGLNEFKKYLNLGSVISFDSHLVGHTHYDEHNKIAKFAFSRTIYLPTLPTWVPASDSINKFLNKQHFRPIFDTELHLTAKGQRGNEGIRYVVSQVGPTERRNATFIEKALPYLLLRPLVTFLVLILANVTGFFQRHSYKEENPVKLALSAVAESWASVRGQSIDREHYPETIKQAQKLSEKIGQAVTTTLNFTTSTAHKATDQARSIGLPVDQTQHLIEMGLHVPTAALHTAGNVTLSALHTAVVIEQASVSAVQSLALNAIGIASGTAHVVEDQAKDLGLPVDEYRELALKRAHDVGEWFGVIKAKAEEQGRRGIQAAQQTAQQVEDATRQGIRQAGETTQRVAEQAIDIAREGVEQGADATQRAARVVKKEAGPTADRAKGVVEEVTPGSDGSNTKTNTDQGGEDGIPRLSSGGHDPNAAGAPSYAAAAH